MSDAEVKAIVEDTGSSDAAKGGDDMPDKVEADSIGARVKELRDKRGLNRAQLAQLTGRSVQAIWMIETGWTLNPKMDTIRALAKALRTSVTALLK